MSPINITIGISRDVNRRFSVSPTNSSITNRSSSSPRFHVDVVRPDSLRLLAETSTSTNSDNSQQIDAAVRAVVADLVNYCEYEMDETISTPSANKFNRSIFRLTNSITTPRFVLF